MTAFARSLAVVDEVLSRRALNRALLARQMLLERQPITPVRALRRLVAMQAQSPHAPYVGLWSRVADFDPHELSALIERRQAVRMPLMRVTVHLVTARDALAWRPVLDGLLERSFHTGSRYRHAVEGVDLDALLEAARTVIESKPRSRAELGPLLAEGWPDRDPESLAHAITYLLPVVQVPPRAIWGKTGQARWTTLDSWLGRAPEAHETAQDELVIRYLGAYGPASVMDAQAFSGLTKLRETFECLRPRLQTFRDENGTELFDLPAAPRPDPDTPAPPRFLPEYDNALLSHADRSRVIADEHRERVFMRGALLVDGFVRGAWKIARNRVDATLVVEPFRPLSKRDTASVTAEGNRLLAFSAPKAKRRAVELV